MQQQNQAPSGWGSSNKTLADYVKESAWQNPFNTSGGNNNASNSVVGGLTSFSASVIGNNHHSALTNNHQHNATTSMPWAAAVKLPPDHHLHQQQQHNHLNQQQHNNVAAAISASNFDYNGGSIGSWSSPETSSSNRGGWNADGSSKNGDGILDDGTAIWGNPSTKKTGVDWAEKEVETTKKSSGSSGSSQTASISSDKRIQKPEPTISSLNGTEAWGAPLRQQQSLSNNTQSSSGKLDINNDNSGNNNFGTSATKSTEWGEPSSLSSSSLQQNNTISNERNSSPPNSDCSVWNNLGISKQKSSDWLSSSSGIGGSSANSISAGSRLDELNKRLESTNIFDSSSTSSSSSSSTTAATATTSLSSSMTKNSSGSNNPNLEQQHQSHNTIGLCLGNSGAIGNGCNNGNGSVGNGINDLRQQMSANFSNDLLDSPNRHQRQQGLGGNLSASNNNQQSQQQLDHSSVAAAAAAAEAATGGAPSRDLLKQMVHQIQLAVQAGHLNAHILNQPMSTPTLQLVYQLLQQIKTLHQLEEIQQRAGLRPSDISGAPSNMDIQINRTRQHISLLQKAITQQQAKNNDNNIGDLNNIKQQQANNYSYATISKLSTNLKVPSNNNMSNIISNSNMDSFRRSSLIDTLSNSNSDSLRSAQANFDANATIDKTLSSLIQQASSSAVANNILSSNKTTSNQSGDSFSKTSPDFDQQANNNSKNVGLFSAQSSSSSAWSAFSSGNSFVNTQQGWPSQLRISSNVSQDHNQYSAFEMVPDFGPSKTWHGSSILSDDKINSNTNSNNNTNSLAPGSGSNINMSTSPSSGQNVNNNNALKQQQQIKRNNILGNRDSSLFCDWSNNSDSGKGNFDQISNTGSTFSSSAIGGLSLQSNPWMFAPTSSSLNIGSGIDRIISKNSSCGDNYNTSNKLDNGNTDKMAGDSSLFLKSPTSGTPNNNGNIQRSSSALYDWGDLASSTTLQYNVDNAHISKQQQSSSASSNAIGGGRPAPPPGLLSNFGSIIGSSSTVGGGNPSVTSNGISLLGNSSDSDSIQMQSRESAANLWSGTWFD